jgi:tetratricopeptide (TPR) repeat protein
MAVRTLLSLSITAALVAASWSAPGAAEPAAPDGAIARYQRALRRSPGDAEAWYRLGDAHVQRARETGEPRHWDRAEQALSRCLELAPTHAGALRHLAFVKSSLHDFTAALAHARRAVELAPDDASAHGVLGDALLELGRYDEAERAFDTMMRLRPDLAALARRSGLRSLRGDAAGAAADLRRAIEIGVAEGQPREHVAWAQWQLGVELFNAGDVEGADRAHRAALVTYPGHHRALAGLGQVRMAQGRPGEAVELYAKALAVIPLPEHAAALGDVHASQGRDEEARRHYALAEYVGRLGGAGQARYDRELAAFLADHDMKIDQALALARREIEARQDVGAWILLAWTLHKAGRSREALDPLGRALALGTRDARLFFRAGMIHLGAGDAPRARDFLARALAINPRFHPIEADLAGRTLADLRRVADGRARGRADAGPGGDPFEP